MPNPHHTAGGLAYFFSVFLLHLPLNDFGLHYYLESVLFFFSSPVN